MTIHNKILGDGISQDYIEAVKKKDWNLADECLLSHTGQAAFDAGFYSPIELDKIVSYNKRNNDREVAEVIKAAEKLVEGYFKLRGNPIEEPYTLLEGDIDWHNSPNGDREGLFSLNVFEYTEELMKAYQYTGDEKYTERFIELISDWIDKCPAPNDGLEHFWEYSPWRSLEAGRRMRYWISAYNVFRHSEHWQSPVNAKFITSVYEHCCQLGERICDITHNHTIMHMEGLLYASVCFDFFDKSKLWRNLAIETLHQCAKHQIREDGIHIEAIPGYHLLAVDLFFRPLKFMERNSLSYEECFKESIKKMMEFSFYAFRPDGTCTPIGDSAVFYKIPYGHFAAIARYVFGDMEFSYDDAVPEMTTWAAPDLIDQEVDRKYDQQLSHLKIKAFEDGGFYCMQSDSSRDRLYAMYHCGPLVHGHPHADLLSMDIFAYGKSLLTDVGIYTYNECTSRRYLKGTQAHNTVVVDGSDQAEYEHRMGFVSIPETKVNGYADKGHFQMVDGEHYGYQRFDEPVTHRRKFLMIDDRYYLVVDQFTGEGEHDFETFWHFNSRTSKMNNETLECYTNDSDDSNVRIIPLADGKMKGEVFESWLSEAYGTKKKADVAKYWIKSPVPLALVTVILPERSGAMTKVEVIENTIGIDEGQLIVEIDKKRYRIINSNDIDVIVE